MKSMAHFMLEGQALRLYRQACKLLVGLPATTRLEVAREVRAKFEEPVGDEARLRLRVAAGKQDIDHLKLIVSMARA
jgi:hypothetical protein